MIPRASLVTAFLLLLSAPLPAQGADSLDGSTLVSMREQYPDTVRDGQDRLLAAISLGGLGIDPQVPYVTVGVQVTRLTHARLAPDVSVGVAVGGLVLESRINGALPYAARRGAVLVPSAGLSLAGGPGSFGSGVDILAGVNAGLAVALLGGGGSGARGALFLHYLPSGVRRATVEVGLADTGLLHR